MESILRDLRFGVRMLFRNPGVTAVAILALALGIGANSAIFSVVYAVLLRPLPVRDAGRLVTIRMASQKLNVTGAQTGFSTYAAARQHVRAFESVAAVSSGTAALTGIEGEDTIKLWRVTESLLPTLGVTPAIGRRFTPEEDQPGAASVALVSDSFWRGRLSGDSRALGTILKIDGQPFTIIGIMPPGFHVDGRPPDVYVPMARSLNATAWYEVNIYARLAPGATIQQAQSEMDARWSSRPKGPLGWEPRLWLVRDFEVRDVRLSLWVLLAAVGVVLLIACANTATLLLARAGARESEIAIRRALGGSGSRLVRQLLTECALLGIIGGAAGVLVAIGCVRLLPLLAHERLPGLLEQVRVDAAVLAFTLAVSLITAVIFGTAPALASRRVQVFTSLREGGRAGATRARRRGWNVLVVAETALALLLAIGATLLVRTFFYLRDVAPGFRVDTLLTARITTPPKKFTSQEQAIAHWANVMDRVRRIPGVQAASFAQALPLTGDNHVMTIPIEGQHFARREDLPVMHYRAVETGYFRTMQIALRRGRLFTERDDRAGAPVAIVNEAFVRRFFPGADALGRHIGGSGEPLYQIVGVVNDVRAEDSTKVAPLEVYFHYMQRPMARIALAVRADAAVYENVLELQPAIARAVADVDRTQTVTHFAEMQRVISDRIAPKRLAAQLIAVFAGLAMVLAAVGIYGLLSFSVVQRTHEIGVRIALGARRGEVLRAIVGEAAALAAIGVALGLAAALALTRAMKALLFGVSAADPAVYAGAAVGLLVIAIAAAVVPAWRAARLDPLTALRQE
jgi:putative ABC transport system permease protein